MRKWNSEKESSCTCTRVCEIESRRERESQRDQQNKKDGVGKVWREQQRGNNTEGARAHV